MFFCRRLSNWYYGGFDMQTESFMDEASDLCGSLEGPKDLSTGADHMEGYGE